MNKLPATLIVVAAVCLVIAILIKLTTMGKVLPAAVPINWVKVAGTALLFSIALSLLGKK